MAVAPRRSTIRVARSDELFDGVVGTDSDNFPVTDRKRLGNRVLGIDRQDRPVDEHRIRRDMFIDCRRTCQDSDQEQVDLVS